VATKNFAILSGATGISSSIKSAISEENPLGYADNLTEQRAVDLLSNQEFLNDASLHYYELDGTRFNTNEELIEAFMSDRCRNVVFNFFKQAVCYGSFPGSNSAGNNNEPFSLRKSIL